MNEIIRTAAISPLRQRMIDDMTVRGFAPTTQRNYVRDDGDTRGRAAVPD